MDLFKNYNLMMILVLLPFFIAFLVKFLAYKTLKTRKNLMKIIFKYSIGEFAFYGYMFSCYSVFTTLIMSNPFSLNKIL